MRELKSHLTYRTTGNSMDFLYPLYIIITALHHKYRDNTGKYFVVDLHLPDDDSRAYNAFILHPLISYLASHLGVKLQWKYVFTNTTHKYVQGFTIIGQYNRVALLIYLFQNLYLSLLTQYNKTKDKKKAYASTYFKTELTKLLTALRKLLQKENYPSMGALEAHIMCQMKLKYRDYHYKTSPIYTNAITKKFNPHMMVN